jgi:hypothetical protein
MKKTLAHGLLILAMLILIVTGFAQNYIIENPYSLHSNVDVYPAHFQSGNLYNFPKSTEEILCPENALYGQPPVTPFGVEVSNITDQHRTAQQFTGIEHPVGGIIVYGVAQQLNGTPCEPTPYTFELKFYENDDGLPGSEVLVINSIEVTGDDTGELFQGVSPIYAFHITLDQPVGLTDGWFSLANLDTPCWFYNILELDGFGAVACDVEGEWELTGYMGATAFCLLPENANANAPDYAENFIITPDAGGNTEALVEWTNPAFTVSGEPLTELDNISLYVNDVLETMITNPEIGANEYYTFAAPDNDMYTFKIVGTNAAGQGLSQIVYRWVGSDVPGKPLNFTLENVNGNGYLTWEHPVEGLHGGFFNGTINAYLIIRYPDELMIFVDGSTTELTDESIPGPAAYYYTLTANNDVGFGGISKSETLYLGDGVTRTLVISEYGTGTWCGFCPSAQRAFEDLKINGWPVAAVGYHFDDPYETPESAARVGYYGFLGFPTAKFDGTLEYSGGNPSQSLYEQYLPLVEERLEIPTPITVEFENENYDGTTFSANVVVDALYNVINENTVLQVVLTESHIPEEWMSEYEVNDVMRTMFNGSEGTPVDLINNNTITIPVSFDIDPGWAPYYCKVVAFVQDNSSKEILNGNMANVLYLPPPTNLTAEVIGQDVLLEWEEPESEDVTGYTIYRDGDLIIFTDGTEYTDPNLENGSYEYFVIAVYDEGFSEKSNTVSIQVGATLCTPEYYIGCSMGASIADFTFNEIENLSSGCEDLSGPGWSQYFEMGPAVVQAGESYEIGLAVDAESVYVSIWIDWNDNLGFEENEIVIDNFQPAEPGTIYAVEFSVPLTVEEGDHILRIRTNWGLPCSDACEQFTWGEAEDYVVTVNVGSGNEDCENFDALTVGGLVAEQLGGMWTTWSGTSADDATVTDMYSNSPENSFIVDAGTVDLVYILDEEPINSGQWLYSHYMYVPSDMDGYFNVQTEPTPGVGWNIEITFAPDGTGTFAGGTTGDFTFTQDAWFMVEVNYDFESGFAQVLFDGEVVLVWANTATIGGIDYYGAGTNPEAYFDDVCFTEGWTVSDPSCENFDALTVGGLIAEQLGGMWTTWSGTSSDDATVSDMYYNSPDNSFIVDAASVDLVYMFDEAPLDAGQWLYSHYIYVPSGYSGYFNVQSEPTPGVGWVVDLFFDDGGTGSFGTSSTETFEYAQDTWILIEINFDLDNNWAEVLFDGEPVTEFMWDGTIGGIDYYGYDTGGTPGSYYDDVCFSNDGWIIIGVEEKLVNSTHIYPNPATEVVYIESENSIEAVTIYNLSGQLIMQRFNSGNKTEFNTSSFEAGVYFIKVLSYDQIITKKLLVE